ncbi:MAG: redoxin domain-containing protein [Bacteroidales bacterium]|nr:redoxin domain-containing protein [Bacteroidales bacterium]
MTKKDNLIFNYILLLFCFLGINVVSAGEVQLYGQSPVYSGEKITFYAYSDYITQDTVHLSTVQIQEDGSFKCSLNLKQVRKIFVNLGVYKGYFFAEPGQSYKLALPEKKEKSKAQQLNPYFKGIPVHIGVMNSDPGELNYQINSFSNTYDKIINKNANNVKNLSRKKDSISTLLDTIVQSENPFFQNYKKYTVGRLKLSLGYSTQKIKNQLLSDEKVLYHNPAYMDFISTLYQNHFKDLFSEHGDEVYHIINRLKSYSRLDSLVRGDPVLKENDRLREMVLLKSLHDAYYDQTFSKKAVRHILDSAEHYVNHKENLRIALNIKEKNNYLAAGDQAPRFCLYDTDSNRVCLEDLRGDYIYLGFCNSKNYSCTRHYNILENLYKKHKKHFKIVIISNSESMEEMKRLAEHHDYPWTFLHPGNQPEVLEQYNVRNMPAYYFINPSGELSLAPAPPPSENIEQKIYKIMKADGAL